MQTLNHWLTALGEDALKEAMQMVEEGKVRPVSHFTDRMATVHIAGFGQPVSINSEGYARCYCAQFHERHACIHVVAAAAYLTRSGIWDQMARKAALNRGGDLLRAVDEARIVTGTPRLEITLRLRAEDRLGVSLRVGGDRLYVVQSIPKLLKAMQDGRPLEFGKNFTLKPDEMRFEPDDEAVLRCLGAYWSVRDFGGSKEEEKETVLPLQLKRELLGALEHTDFILETEDSRQLQHGIAEKPLTLDFTVTGSSRELSIDAAWNRDVVPVTPDFAYAFSEGALCRVPAAQQPVFRALRSQLRMGTASYRYGGGELQRAVSELLPMLRLAGTVDVDAAIRRRLVTEELRPAVYLDLDGRAIAARVSFGYGAVSVNPFGEEQKDAVRREGWLVRDIAGERRVLETLSGMGFRAGGGGMTLRGEDAQYDFITGGVQRLQERCEVYLSNEFRRVSPRRLRMGMSMRLNAGKLELSFPDEEATPEMLAILEAIDRRKRYFRLKDGSFIDLTGMEEWREVAHAVTEAGEKDAGTLADRGVVELNTYRGFYLHSLLDGVRQSVTEDDGLADAMRALDGDEDENVAMPAGLALRGYQQRGFHWLMTLDRLRMGGVLADDMGLGKTVQIIAVLKAARAKDQISLIVAPTSLVYNWLSELNRFAPELSVMVVSGTAQQRAAQLHHAAKAKDIDVLITSYPLIRRDIEAMRAMRFRFAILDEAQHIKNVGSVGAKAVKLLQAQTRFALTGTPMENGTGELWSIFDFVLPGYLMSYRAFLHTYQDNANLDDLRMRIRPFLLRRLKKDVLTELPDKLETRLTAQLTPEQERVYQASLTRLRDRVYRVMDEKGLNRGRIEVLSAITELRQICCHPALVMSDYAGSAGKVELLLDILPGAIASGHRILLFSQFTSMLRILRRRLEEAGYTCLYLDGSTPGETRLDLTARFNAGEGQVFLISLKAGGTGLNLTGADMVIHYDPWWNPAAEDQATDRAHRIGQTRVVEVIRLVTHGTIEEQVVELGQRKKELFDQLITPGEELVTSLTEREVRELFG